MEKLTSREGFGLGASTAVRSVQTPWTPITVRLHICSKQQTTPTLVGTSIKLMKYIVQIWCKTIDRKTTHKSFIVENLKV